MIVPSVIGFVIVNSLHTPSFFNPQTIHRSQFDRSKAVPLTSLIDGDDEENEVWRHDKPLFEHYQKQCIRYGSLNHLLMDSEDCLQSRLSALAEKASQRSENEKGESSSSSSSLSLEQQHKYHIDQSMVIVREGTCGFPIQFISMRSDYAQVVLSGVLRVEQSSSGSQSSSSLSSSSLDGKEICVLGTSVNNKPFTIDHLMIVEDNGELRHVFDNPIPQLDFLNRFFRSRKVIQTEFVNGCLISSAVQDENEFKCLDNKTGVLLNEMKPYFEYERKKTFWQKALSLVI